MRHAALVVALPLVATGLTVAQAPPQFRSGVQLVHVDVSVFDADGNAVEDLQLSDFEVFEDGRPVEPALLRATRTTPVSRDDTPSKDPDHDFAAVQFDNHDVPGGRVLAIVLDTHQIGFSPRQAYRTRQFARTIVDDLGPSDYAAILTPGGLPGQQSDFTRNKALLRAAIEKFRPGATSPATTRAEQSEKAYRAVSFAQAIKTIVDVLASIEDRRKGIVIVSGGTPFPAIEPTARRDPDADDVRAALTEAAHTARLANVPLHTFYPGIMDGPMRDGQRSLAWLSEQTNGIAAVNTNTLEPNAAAVLQATATHYLLGYYSSAPLDGEFHNIEVKVSRPGVSVNARRGFVSNPPKAMTDLADAIQFPLPLTDLSLQVVGVPVPAQGKPDAGVALGIELGNERAAEHRDHDVLIVVTDMKGEVEEERRITIRDAGSLLKGDSGRKVRAATQLMLDAGRYVIRVAARRLDDGAVGTALAQVEVPKFRGDLRMSAIGIVASDSDEPPPSPERHGLLESIPIAPYGLSADERVAAIVRLSTRGRAARRGSSIHFAATLTDEEGRTRELAPSVRPSADFASPAGANHRIELPPLPRGTWRLAVTASADSRQSETRTLPLVIK